MIIGGGRGYKAQSPPTNHIDSVPLLPPSVATAPMSYCS